MGIQRGLAATWGTVTLDLERLGDPGEEESKEVFLEKTGDPPSFTP